MVYAKNQRNSKSILINCSVLCTIYSHECCGLVIVIQDKKGGHIYDAKSNYVPTA